jgi:probable HAF family extracellular repeat protein
MRRLLFAALASGALLVSSGQSSATPFFVALGNLDPRAASADGSVVVGGVAGAQGHAFRWTQAGGADFLADVSGALTPDSANGVSADGSVVVGGANYGTRAFRWTEAEGAVDLGRIPGAPEDNLLRFALGVSADGTVIVGQAFSGTAYEPFRWTAAGGMVGLGLLPMHGLGFASAVSADGSVVVGSSSGVVGVPSQAFRWTQENGMVGLGVLGPQGFKTEALGVSADGSVIVGRPGFRWTESGGMESLAANGLGRSPHGVSADGSIVVGDNDALCCSSDAFIWDAEHGTRRLTYPGWTLTLVSGISADGTTVFGHGRDPNGGEQGWVASIDALTIVPEPGTCLLLATGLVALAARREPRDPTQGGAAARPRRGPAHARHAT